MNTNGTDDNRAGDEAPADETNGVNGNSSNSFIDSPEFAEAMSNPIPFGDNREEPFGSGNVRIEVESIKADGTVSDMTGSLNGTTERILTACLTESEREAVSSGTNVVVKLVVSPLVENVPDTDKKQIDTALTNISNASLTLGNYLDLTVMKKVGDGDWEKVPNLAEELLITIDIDEELKADGRVFYVLRSHEGAVTMLFDLDDDPDTVTIKTGLFSTYALAYTDSAEAATAIMESAGSDATGLDLADDSAKGIARFAWWIILLIILAVVGGYIYYRRKKSR